MRASGADLALVVVLGALWGGSFFVIKIAVETVPATSVAAGRMAVAAAAMGAVLHWRQHRLPRSIRLWSLYVAIGLLGNALPFTLIGWGEERIDSSLASILMSVTPLVTLLLAHVLTVDERLTARRVAGIAAGMLGVAVLVGPEAIAGLGDNAIRQSAVALGAVCYAVTNVLARKLPKSVPEEVNAAGVLIAGCALWIPISLVADAPWTVVPSAASLGAIVALGLLPTALATLVYLRIVRRAGATAVSFANFLVPLFGVLLGWAVLGETLGAASAAALLLILFGMALARGR